MQHGREQRSSNRSFHNQEVLFTQHFIFRACDTAGWQFFFSAAQAGLEVGLYL